MKQRSILAVLLALVFLPVCFHAQSEISKSSIQIDSFGLTPNGDFRARADVFMQELSSQPDSRALIVVYGSPAQIASRKRLINNHFSYFRKFPLSRLDVKVGGNVSAFRTDFWLVPAGAAPPEIKPEAWIFKEVGRATNATLVRAVNAVIDESFKFDRHQTYIINYGTSAQVAQRERWIRNAIAFRRFDGTRITLVNGGPGPVRTVMWLVPPGVENPKP